MPGRTALVSLAALVAALVMVVPASALDIADASPPAGTVGVPYNFTFSLSPGSGSAGASWSISSGALPPGLALSSNDRTGTVYGTPTQAGAFSFYLKVTDAPGPWVCCTEEQFTILIDAGLDIVSGPDLPVRGRGRGVRVSARDVGRPRHDLEPRWRQPPCRPRALAGRHRHRHAHRRGRSRGSPSRRATVARPRRSSSRSV